MNFKNILTIAALTGFSASVAIGQGTAPTIVQGDYVSNVFGQSNFVKNPNAKLNTKNVSVSSATVTRSATTPLVATSEYNVAVTSANGTVSWATRSFDAGMKNQNCEARFSYRGFQATSKAQIKQGANVVAELTLTPSATDPRIASINFPCGDLSAATTFVITDSATLSGTNEIGGIYVGLATNQANVAQAENVVRVTRTGAQTVGSTSAYSTFVYNTKVFDVYDEFDTSTGVFTAKRSGKYMFNASMLWADASWSAGHIFGIGIRKGSVLQCETFKEVEQTQSAYQTAAVTCSVDVQVGEQFNVGIFQVSGTNKDTYLNTSQNWFEIYRFPSSSELVVTPETQNVWGGVKYAGSSDYIQTTGVSDSIVNTTVFGTPSFFGGASASSSACGLTTNDIGMCLQNVPPGTYEISTNLEFGNRYADGTPGFAICSGHVAVTGSSLTTTKTASALAYSPITNGEDWSQLGTGIVKIDSLQSYLSIVVKVTKTSGAGGCRIRSASSGSSINSHPTITFKPLDNASNSALYVQGPVKAAATGAAIPAGYVGQVIETTDNGVRLQNSPTLNSWYAPWGGAIDVPAGTWLICYSATVAANQTSALNAGAVVARIRNLTDATTLMDQAIWPTYDATSSTAQVQGFGGGVSGCRTVTITSSKSYQLQVSTKAVWGTPTYTAGYVGIRGDFSTTYVKATRLN